MDNTEYRYHFIAGHLALDFVNTVAFRADAEKRQDRLERAEDAQRWASEAELPDWTAIAIGPKISAAALRHIRVVREHLFALFHAIALEDPMSADTLARVGNSYQDCSARRRLSNHDADVRWVWRATARTSDYLLYPVLTAATELLTSNTRALIRQCEDTGCGWLFLDRSNARKRRWCSMADCGNRNKARNFYRREPD